MAVTRVKLGHSTLREKLGALLFLACILAGSVIGAGVVGPMRYQAQMDALDLAGERRQRRRPQRTGSFHPGGNAGQ